jgi:hypothetical protein
MPYPEYSPQVIDEAFRHVAGDVPREKDIAGALKVGSVAALNELLFGLPELAWKKMAKPSDTESWEKLKSEHKLAGMIGGGLGLGTSMLIPGGAARLAARGAGLAARAARPVASYFRLGEKAAEAVGKAAIPASIRPLAAAGAKGATEALTFAAPRIAGEMALGDGDTDTAITEALLSAAVGGGIGAAGSILGKALPKMTELETLKDIGFSKGAALKAAKEGMDIGETARLAKQWIADRGGSFRDPAKRAQFLDEIKTKASDKYIVIDEATKGAKLPGSKKPKTMAEEIKKTLVPEEAKKFTKNFSSEQKKDIDDFFARVAKDAPKVENQWVFLGKQLNKKIAEFPPYGKGTDRELRKYYLDVEKHVEDQIAKIVNQKAASTGKDIYKSAQKEWAMYRQLEKVARQQWGGTLSELFGGGSDTAIKLLAMQQAAPVGISVAAGGGEALQQLKEGDIASAAGSLARGLGGYVAGRAAHRAIPSLTAALERIGERHGAKIEPALERAAGAIIPAAVPEKETAEKTEEQKKVEAMMPEAGRPWYETEKGNAILTQTLQEKYENGIASGIIPEDVSFEQFADAMAEKSRGFDPLAISHWFFDKEEIKDFRKQYSQYQAQQRAISEIEKLRPALEKFGFLSTMTLTGGKEKVAADRIADILQEFEIETGKYKSPRPKKVIGKEIYDLLKNRSLTPDEKMEDLKNKFYFGDTTLLQQMGLV